jgi:hypothetical protein
MNAQNEDGGAEALNGPAPGAKHDPAVAGGSDTLSVTKTRVTTEARSKKGHLCRPLPRKFRRRKLNYRLIAREGKAAIYEQTWSGCHNPSVCYEVIRIRRRDGFHIGGRFVEPAEVYPNSEAWGTDGFTLTDKDAASAKLHKLIPLILSLYLYLYLYLWGL